MGTWGRGDPEERRGEPALGQRPLERERELAALGDALASIRVGAGAVIVLEGAPGIGKSRLLDESEKLAAGTGVDVLRARCEELESALPWSLARSLLTPALEAMTADRRRSLERAGEGAAELFTVAGDHRADAPLERGQLLRVAHALTWLTADLAASEPLALLIDDLHWADRPSLHFIAYLAARAEELPVTLVLARRSREPGSSGSLLERIAGHPHASTIELRPLGDGAVGRLVNDALGGPADAELIAACAEVTGGNPFYLRELLRELQMARAAGGAIDAGAVRAAAPSEVVRSVCLRMERLGPAAVGLARSVAVLGGGACSGHAAELAELEPAAAAGALDALAAAEILLPADPLGFVHPLVAAAVHEDLGLSLRGELHLRAARLLARERVDLARVAVHLLAGARRGDDWVVQTLREAAIGALAQGAGELARDYLARALEEPPAGAQRAAVLGELGRVEASLGRPEAGEHLRGAVELTSEGLERARAMLELGRALALAGDHPRAVKTFEEGSATLAEQDSELGRELQAAWWMSAILGGGARTSAAAVAPPDLGDLQPPLSGGQRQLLALLAQQRAFEGASPDEVRELAERAWGAGELLRAEGCDGRAWSLVTGASLIVDELELELEVCNAAIEDARIHGSPTAYATASYCRSWPLLRRGQIDDAAADIQSALAARADGWGAFLGAAIAAFVLICLEQGAIDEAQATLSPTLADPVMRERGAEFVLLMWASARLLLARGMPEEALGAMLQLGERASEIGLDRPALLPWRAYASCAAGLVGDRERARSLGVEALASAEATGIARVIAEALRMRARVERGEQALATLQQAAALLPASPPRLERVYVLVELGAALRRLQRRAEARDPLQEGLRIAQANGARALADLAAAELHAAGVKPGLRAQDDRAEKLTPSERRVARLAAEGHSNREIAQLLFVTVKTVEYHLGNTYRKLGIERRSQLARTLAEPASVKPVDSQPASAIVA